MNWFFFDGWLFCLWLFNNNWLWFWSGCWWGNLNDWLRCGSSFLCCL
jgi:hypothetical protein